MFKKVVFSLFVAFCGVTDSFAQFSFVNDVSNKGTVAAAFLEIGVNARAEAMGGAYSAMNGTADMAYWNPAGLTGIRGVGGTFSNTEWLAETTFNYASFAVPIAGRKTVLAASFTTLGVPDQPVRDFDGSLTGEQYNARDYAASISISRELIPSFSFGVTAKYINQRIWTENATGIAFDFGVFYNTPIRGLTMGSSISNFGGEMSMNGRNLNEIIDPDPNNEGVTNIPVRYETDSFPLPQLFRFGLAYNYSTEYFSVVASTDLMHPTGSTESINTGLELGFKDLVFARAGYQNLFERDHINGLTLGLGLQYMLSTQQRFAFDYAHSDWGMLGSAHRISMSFYYQ
ncbi:MAG: PorV/PorQ family protein [Bacteroidetes bacterium]|jgi:hypothetical protein|nr:PorV/PorQ family protein [Bacteroidota bacterium]